MSVDSLAELMRPGALEAKLSRAFPRIAQTGALIGVRVGDESRIVSMGPLELAPTGCITKLFTAALIGNTLESRGIGLHSQIAPLLDSRQQSLNEALGSVTVRQLLEHTHGLDDSVNSRVPLLASGYIDVPALCERLSVPRLARPGYGSSYSDAGGWLLGALLERLHGRPYPEILRDKLFRPVGIRSFRFEDPVTRERDVCPALGRALAISVDDMLEFVQHHLSSDDPWCLKRVALDTDAATLPGWSPLECGVRLGWKLFGSGWYGHNSVLHPTPALLRVNPSERMALFIATTDHSPTAVATAIFGKALPGIVRLQMPKLLDAEEIAGLSLEPYVGIYQNAATRFEVALAGNAGLELRAHRRNGAAIEAVPFLRARLRPARDHIFFTQPSEPRVLPFVQFVAPSEGEYRDLWNGTALWPNVSSTPQGAQRAFRSSPHNLALERISP